MSEYGLDEYGIDSFGADDFAIILQNPGDAHTNITRRPIISFLIYSGNIAINLSTLDLSVNGIDLIVNGDFITTSATGTINDTNPNQVFISATIAHTHTFQHLELVNVIVYVEDNIGGIPTDGTTWSFTTNDLGVEFQMYIVRDFERVLRAS